jgi:ankyrin repeat protein
VGATRTASGPFFFTRIRHYLYAGDTALHMAAAAYQRAVAELLIAHGADVHAKNRLGATPLHYAADTNHWDPHAQAETIAFLISLGADPDATNRLDVTPLHRAVRTRSAPAVKALLEGGADPRKKNGSGSTPLRLAMLTTGRGGSGSARARQQQAEIVRLLREAIAGSKDSACTS